MANSISPSRRGLNDSVFPQEVYENVIDHSRRDRRTLANCGLVCRAWVSTSRYHLFHMVQISPGDSRFLEILTFPGRNVASYICSVKIFRALRVSQDELDLLYQVLIILRDTTPGYRFISFWRLPLQLDRLSEVLPLSRIVDVEVNYCQFDNLNSFMALFGLMPHLRKLELHEVKHDGIHSIVEGVILLPQLRTLGLFGDCDIVQIMQSIATPPTLRELEFEAFSNQEILCIGSFLRPVMNCLVKLEIDILYDYCTFLSMKLLPLGDVIL
jgi:hypothetical protein